MNTDKIVEKRKRLKQELGYSFPNFDVLKNISDKNYQTEYGYAINYANYMYESKDLKEFAQAGTMQNLNKVPDWEFRHLGIMFWLKSQGVDLSPEKLNEMNNRVASLATRYNVPEKKVVSIKVSKTDNVIAELEGVIDDVMSKKTVQQPLTILQANAGTLDIEYIRKHFADQLEEVKNPDLAEYFERTDVKRLSTVLNIILNDLNKFKAVKQTTRKVRVVRARKVVPSKMVRKLKYLKEFLIDKGSLDEYKLVSIAPEKIVGAEIVWVYNTKTRKLGKYVSNSTNGLMVKGSTILNYDESQSISKKLRKPEEVIMKLNEAGKVEQRKLLDPIKAVASAMTGRINKDTILVKVF